MQSPRRLEKALTSPPPLIPSSLLKIPMQARFILAGTLSNIVFVSMYNSAMPWLHHQMAASTIYAIVYFVFIPISHALNAMVVFGWPKDYGTSLLSNFPIGLSAILIGSFCTAYLDKTNFEAWADDFVRNVILNKPRVETDDVQELGEFYSSLVVMVITGIWSYVISVMVNTPTKEPHKKEL